MSNLKLISFFGKCVIDNELFQICEGKSPLKNCKACYFYDDGKCNLNNIECFYVHNNKYLHFEKVKNLTFRDKFMKFLLTPMI